MLLLCRLWSLVCTKMSMVLTLVKDVTEGSNFDIREHVYVIN